MQLEKSGEESDDFAELTAEFPKIKSISDLPDSVVQKSELRGTKLLDEYLRYRLTEEREAASAALQTKKRREFESRLAYRPKGRNQPGDRRIFKRSLEIKKEKKYYVIQFNRKRNQIFNRA